MLLADMGFTEKARRYMVLLQARRRDPSNPKEMKRIRRFLNGHRRSSSTLWTRHGL